MMKGNNTEKGMRLELLKEKLLRQEKSLYELMDETGYSRRTIFRDLKELKARGYNLFKTGNDSYRISPIEEDMRTVDVTLSMSEVKALLTLCDYVEIPASLKKKLTAYLTISF